MVVLASTRTDITLSTYVTTLKILVWQLSGTFLPLHMARVLVMALEALSKGL